MSGSASSKRVSSSSVTRTVEKVELGVRQVAMIGMRRSGRGMLEIGPDLNRPVLHR
jgi:hypothetical protein